MESVTDTRSAELYRRALAVLPGGVNSPVRAMRAIGRDPIFIDRGEGAELVDVDGNRYVDYVCSWGPLIHGHAHPRVLRRGRRGGRAGDELRRADRGRGGAGARGGAADAGRGDAAHDLLGHRGDDDGAAARARGNRPRARAEVRGRLPRPRRRPARRGGLGARHAGAARQPRRARERDGSHGGGAVERPRGAGGGHRASTSSPRSSPSRCPPTWASSRPARASSSCCASAPTRPARCSSSTR